MPADTGEAPENKDLLVWPLPITNEVRGLFTMVFAEVFGLINYICQVLTKTNSFNLIIPLNCLGQLIKDRIHQFPQVVRIDVICDSIRDLKQIKPWFAFGFEKIKFYTIDNVSSLWDIALHRRALITSSSINEVIKNAIISMIQARILAKRSDISSHRFQIVKQFVNTILHSFPVKNINNFASCYICPSCKFVYGRACRLECEHQQCAVCVQIQKKCATCFKDISRDKVKVNENLPMEMQNLQTHCSDCESIQPLKDYEVHLKENHGELITRFICDQEVDENAVMSFNGACIWEISDIEQIKNNATTDGPKSIYSPAFYLFPKGYKMCLRLFINGDCKARDTHMSIFFVIMRGEHDKELQWPFKFKATFSLIDQLTTNDNQHHVSEDCWPNSKPECFECPFTNMNNAFGIPLFIPLNLFTKYPNRYIKNNTMYIKFAIDPFAEKPAEPMMNGGGELPNEEKHTYPIADEITDLICSSDFNESLQKSK